MIVKDDHFRSVWKSVDNSQSLRGALADMLIANGPGAIDRSDQDWRAHQFYFNKSPYLWSAFNRLYFKIRLEGDVCGGKELKFTGKMEIDVQDNFTFGDTANADRQPFEWVWALPRRYRYFKEGRFKRLEDRDVVRAFMSHGEYQSEEELSVNTRGPRRVRMRPKGASLWDEESTP